MDISLLQDKISNLENKYKRDQEDNWTMVKSLCEDNHLLHENLKLCAEKIRELTLQIEELKNGTISK